MFRRVTVHVWLMLAAAATAQSSRGVQRGPEESPAAGTACAPRIAVEEAPAPLYDDPVWHGASDPAVVWLPGKGENQGDLPREPLERIAHDRGAVPQHQGQRP